MTNSQSNRRFSIFRPAWRIEFIVGIHTSVGNLSVVGGWGDLVGEIFMFDFPFIHGASERLLMDGGQVLGTETPCSI